MGDLPGGERKEHRWAQAQNLPGREGEGLKVEGATVATYPALSEKNTDGHRRKTYPPLSEDTISGRLARL